MQVCQEWHEVGRAMAAFKVRSVDSSTTTPAMQAEGGWGTVPLCSLKPTSLKELMHLNTEDGRGRFLVGTLCIDASIVPNNHLVVSMLETSAEGGGDGDDQDLLINCVLEVQRATRYSATHEDVGAAMASFPKGAIVAVKEPTFRPLPQGMPRIIVGSPASLEFVGLAPQLLREHGDPTMLRMAGNGEFSKGHFVMAGLYYSEAAALSVGHAGEHIAALSNKTEVCLRLGRFEEAISSADRVLEVDPTHVKSLIRKAKGLRAIQEHAQAVACAELALEWYCCSKANEGRCPAADGVQQQIEEFLGKCKALLSQSRSGSYDIADYLVNGMERGRAPECADYVGPVEIRMAEGRKGRGLFAKRDAELGELMLVSNAVAMCWATEGETEEPSTEDVMTEVRRACAKSSRAAAQLCSLADVRRVPALAPFLPNAALPGPPLGCNSLNPSQIEETVCRCCQTVRTQRGVCGMWALPGLINHSCLPNVSLLRVGNAMFVHAAKSIRAGEEMVVAYTEPFVPWSGGRRKGCEALGFTCTCERCLLECSMDHALKEAPLQRHVELGIEFAFSQEEARETVTRVEKHIPDDECRRLWLRASFFHAYVQWLTPLECVRMLHAVGPGGSTTLMKQVVACRKLPLGELPLVTALLQNVFTAHFGKQRPDVLRALLGLFVENLLTNW